MINSLLDVKNLRVSFKRKTSTIRPVDGVNISIAEGSLHAVVGESGSGKTLTALSIMRLLPPGANLDGEILFRGKNLTTLQDKEMMDIRGNRISMIFQEPMTSLNPVFTVGNQLIETIMTHTDLSCTEAKDLAIELLKKVKIPSPEIRIREYPHQMSGGMRQRIMIAMAIACNPDLIIADEPTTALDVTIQAQILELLSELRMAEGMSILLITHDLGIVAEWAETVDVMYAGRIMESTSVKTLFTNPLHPYTMGLLESLPSPGKDMIKPIPGQIPRLDQLPQGCKFMPRCTYSIRECEESEPGLISIDNGHYVRCIRAGEIRG